MGALECESGRTTIPVQAAAAPGAESVEMPRVVVLPRIPITSILPPDNTAVDYDIPAYCKTTLRTMGTTQITIKALFAKLVNEGRGYDIQLRL